MLIQKGLVNDRVSDLEMSAAVIVAPDASIGTVVSKMQAQRVGCVLIQDGPSLAGIFTERDVLVRVLRDGCSMNDAVTTVMTPNPKTIKLNDSVEHVVRLMHDGGLRHLPVIGEDGAVAGIVSVKRIVQHLVEHFPQAVYNLPPDPAVVATAREGG